MKQVMLDGSGQVVVADVPVPTAAPGGIVVRTAFSLISSGTEASFLGNRSESLLMKAIRHPEKVKRALKRMAMDGIRPTVESYQSRSGGLAPIGYSCAGVVIEVGDGVTGFKVGDHVACAGTGYANHAEYVFVPENLACLVSEKADLKEAAFTTLGSIAMQGIRRANVDFGSSVVVIGLGLVGQLTVQILKAYGCLVFGIDLEKSRVKLAMELGMDEGCQSGEKKLGEQVLAFTSGIGADAVLLCAGTSSSEPARLAMELCRKKGTVVVVGAVGMDLKRPVFYEKELDFVISKSYGPGRYDPLYEEAGVDYPVEYVRWTEKRNMTEFLRLMEGGNVCPSTLISRTFKAEKAPDAYALLKSEEERPLGLLLDYSCPLREKAPAAPKTRKVKLRSDKPPEGKVHIGIIGAGGFCQSVHLPHLRGMGECRIEAIATRRGQNAKKLGEQYGAQFCTTDYRELLEDPGIDTVLIATRHNLHARIAIEALQAGKHVFVEKPMGLSVKECREVIAELKKGALLLTVGFNRRLSPLYADLKKELCAVTGPMQILYRVNAGHIPTNHWTRDPVEGGGRILGEGCHFFDLILDMAGADPVEIDAVGDADETTAVLRFRDGSCATLVYTTRGNMELHKEYIEAHRAGCSFVLDDYLQTRYYGAEKKGIKLQGRNKGHYEELLNFVKAIRSESELMVTAMDGLKATACCVAALESSRKRKPVSFIGICNQ